MKKIIAICLILTMIASLSLSVFATGGFLSSPSANPAPELIVGENEDEDGFHGCVPSWAYLSSLR